MSVIKRLSCSGVLVVTIIGILLCLAIRDCILTVYTNKYGITQTVMVTFQETVYLGKGRGPIIRTCGYYYVDNKRYKAFTDKRVPIGTRFEIKYCPKMPKWYNRLEIIQE